MKFDHCFYIHIHKRYFSYKNSDVYLKVPTTSLDGEIHYVKRNFPVRAYLGAPKKIIYK